MNCSLISVIVPVYKAEKYLHNCVESVINQSYPHWELMLVDDGSPDRCGSICDEYAAKDLRIHVIHKENGGQASARNAALDVAVGEYVTFLDSDDFWHKDYLSIMLNLCRENDADMSQCHFVRGTDTVFPSVSDPVTVSVYDNRSVFVNFKDNVILCGKLYKRSMWKDIRMPVGKKFEDDFTAWKLYYKSRKIALTTQPLYYYTYNDDSTMAKQKKSLQLDFLEAYKERISFFSEKNDEALEHLSRCQLQKNIVLNYANKSLTASSRKLIKSVESDNYSVIRHSKYIPKSVRLVFWAFDKMPMLTSSLTLWLYRWRNKCRKYR